VCVCVCYEREKKKLGKKRIAARATCDGNDTRRHADQRPKTFFSGLKGRGKKSAFCRAAAEKKNAV
jgi:hypothetical protein